MSSASSTPANEATSSPKNTKPPNKWTLEEDNLLQQAMILQDGENINWHEVAACVPGRNNKDCRKRWVYNLSLKPKKGRWSKDEDARLLNAAQNLQYRWAEVAKVVGGRQPDQCSRRWHETVNPNISHERWSLLEDETLRLAVQMHGRKWTEIVERYFYNRTPIAAKNR
ncbi:Transcriptional activator Myb protein [Rutstroemia sp. NJR-2017a BBW]|nr:Transcriptional activator Myb protein [Rutstroemia sp. NJR-2017a BBW]